MADDNNSNPEQRRIADLSQEQLGVSQAQFGKINAQNEALGAVILELAAAQAQAGEIEQRQIKREKFYRRRDFIFNQIVYRFQRVAEKKAAIAAVNANERDLIEQEAQVDSGIAVQNNTNVMATLTGFIQKDISRLTDFMIGKSLQDEENRREMLAALKDKGGGRREFKAVKYQGLFKTLGKVLIGLPFFLIGFFQGYFGSLQKVLGKLGKLTKFPSDKIGAFFNGIQQSISGVFQTLGKKLKPITDAVGKTLTKVKGNKVFAKVFGFIGKVFSFVQNTIGKIVNGPVGKAITGVASKALNIGKIFGRLFLPINIIIGAFAAFKGFMKGFKEGGILEGLKQGIISVVDALIGAPLRMLSSLVSFVFKMFGFENTGKAFKENFDGIIQGIYDAFGGLIDVIKGIFTFDGETLKAGLGQIWTGLKAILMAPVNFFKGIIEDIFGGGEETSFIDKIKGLYDKIVGFIQKPFNAAVDFLKGLNPFSQSEQEKLDEIAKLEARIARSESGENEFLGNEEKGRAKTQAKIDELRKELANNGANMAALEKQNADMQSANSTSQTIVNNITNNNSSSSTQTTFHQGEMLDEGVATSY
jgi:hypothetical protein